MCSQREKKRDHDQGRRLLLERLRNDDIIQTALETSLNILITVTWQNDTVLEH